MQGYEKRHRDGTTHGDGRARVSAGLAGGMIAIAIAVVGPSECESALPIREDSRAVEDVTQRREGARRNAVRFTGYQAVDLRVGEVDAS
jgi:hypothetical protein